MLLEGYFRFFCLLF